MIFLHIIQLYKQIILIVWRDNHISHCLLHMQKLIIYNIQKTIYSGISHNSSQIFIYRNSMFHRHPCFHTFAIARCLVDTVRQDLNRNFILQKILSHSSRHADTHLLKILRFSHHIRLQIKQNPHTLFRCISIHINHKLCRFCCRLPVNLPYCIAICILPDSTKCVGIFHTVSTGFKFPKKMRAKHRQFRRINPFRKHIYPCIATFTVRKIRCHEKITCDYIQIRNPVQSTL